MPHRLTFSAIAKQFGSHTALHPLSLTLEDGEILGFLGPNGAGKTTAIHLALGFLHPSAGSGTLLGKPFGDAQARSRLGFVADVPVFFAESAASSVELAARLNGVSDPNLARTIRSLLGDVGLAASLREDAKPRRDARQYSRGMQQRLALAQALVNDPDLLILDEPAAALDPAGVQQVRELLRSARHAGKSIFFSSHQLTEVEHICDRIAFLNQGKLVHCGSLKEFQSASDQVEIELRNVAKAVLDRFGGAHAEAGLRITIPAHDQRRVIEEVWAAGGEIVSLTPVRRRLEDLFLEWSAGPNEGRGSAP